jgi:hypothetical protein
MDEQLAGDRAMLFYGDIDEQFSHSRLEYTASLSENQGDVIREVRIFGSTKRPPHGRSFSAFVVGSL